MRKYSILFTVIVFCLALWAFQRPANAVTVAKGEQAFYLVANGVKYFLFNQAFRRSNKDVFEKGISLFDLS